jgi:outer membrane immunogenic protein
MKIHWEVLAAAGLLMAQVAGAQAIGAKHGFVDQTPAIEIPVSLQLFRANAPPKGCGCFWMYGGGAGVVLNFTTHWSGIADLAYGQASKINGTNQNLKIFNYQVGPRYSLRNHTKWTPYAQALVGGSEVFSNYNIYSGGKNSFSSTIGGGLTMRVSDHIGITVAEGSWMHAQAVNGVNSRQNNLRLTTGIVFRFPPR